MGDYATVMNPVPDQAERTFERIIGDSAALESVLDQVEQVAPTDSTVLIEGETGTGKELIAHAIHNASQRCGRAFIKLNCAAIPLDLLESELFGHEKGAFTGAIAQKIGRFEMADKGTLFLDEVGDIPSALQPKLLRVLQEQEFERLGSGRTHKVDVRLVAATNRDLMKMVARGQFRSDLYYRLNVFPILLPALRERREDIPALVTHFVKLFSRRMGKQVDSVPPETMAAFQWYLWPGNIRELQNLVERAVILSRDGVLPNPLHKKQTELMLPSLHRTRTFPSSMTLEDSGSRSDCGNTGAGRLDRRWTARRSGETGTETNHTACQDEKVGYLAAYPSGRNQRSRSRARRCPDLKVKLAASHGIKLEGSKREPVEQTVIDPILSWFAHMQLRLLTPGFLQRSLLVLCIALNSCQSHKANSGPSIEFTHIPSAAQGGRERVDTISGRVRKSRPKQQIVIYAHSGQWWVQPWPPYLGS